MRPPLTTTNQDDHAAAAAYIMKHAGASALMVLHAHTGQPIGIITEKDIALRFGLEVRVAGVDPRLVLPRLDRVLSQDPQDR
jgi:CBS domain-containing protein